MRPMSRKRMCGPAARRCCCQKPPGVMPAVSVDMIQPPNGSAITQTYQMRKPPRTAPQLLPEPPTMTITQMRKV